MLVYLATDTETGARYVGATGMTLKRRRQMHVRNAPRTTYAFHVALRERPHAFTWAVLAECDDKELLNLAEQEAIDKFKTHVSQGGYNMTTGGIGSRGHTQTAEQIQRSADKRRGAKRTPEMRARMAAASSTRVLPVDAHVTIEMMRAEGQSNVAIGKHYGVSESTIRQHTRRRKA